MDGTPGGPPTRGLLSAEIDLSEEPPVSAGGAFPGMGEPVSGAAAPRVAGRLAGLRPVGYEGGRKTVASFGTDFTGGRTGADLLRVG